jgi:alkanesulfonate monooxygenase SsuD/methylene tetrahydromethanopterin reductase-like flavin-dependent oxidoreductase (luciferase family)
MKVFLFDLIAYGAHFEDAKAAKLLPYPLPGHRFDREVGARTFEEHLEAWAEMDRLGFDGVGLNEHHTTAHSLMNSPNMMAAAGAQRTKNLKFLLLGNLLPLHNPLRIAEELAMADCLSRGRILSGFARGVPREYGVYGVPMAESRARFEEAVDIILKAWTEDVFSYEGKFWSYKDISIWPRPYARPYPSVWVPFTGSKETIEWAGKHDFSAVIPALKRGVLEDITGYFAKAKARHGHRLTPDQLCLFTDVYVAPDKDTALREYGDNFLYFNQTLWHHGSLGEKNAAKSSGYVASSSYDYVRPENRADIEMDRDKIRQITQSDLEARVHSGALAWGSGKEIAEQLIEKAEHAGANAWVLNLNLGALPHAMFMEQIRRFARDVLPALHAHEVKRVPAAERAVA